MKVIFLDIDGVLNNEEWYETHPFKMGHWHNAISPELVGRLNQIIERTGAVVVLSSTWRHIWSAELISEVFRGRGANFNVHDITPPEVKGRCDAIREWLKLAARFHAQDIAKEMEGGMPAIESWIALDDAPECHVLGDHWVEVPDGLTQEHVEKAVKLLGEKE